MYLHPHFYDLPFELEDVPGMEILGTMVDTAQRRIQLVLPQQSISLRSPCTVSSTRRNTQGLTTHIYLAQGDHHSPGSTTLHLYRERGFSAQSLETASRHVLRKFNIRWQQVQ